MSFIAFFAVLFIVFFVLAALVDTAVRRIMKHVAIKTCPVCKHSYQAEDAHDCTKYWRSEIDEMENF